MTTDTGEPTPPADLVDKLRVAADRLIAGTPLNSDGKLTILSLAQEAQIKRWLLTHKYPRQLKEKYQAEFQAVQNRSAPVRAAERDIDTLRAELRTAREDNRRLTQLNQLYATIISQLTEDLDIVSSERDALRITPAVSRIPRRMEKRNAPA